MKVLGYFLVGKIFINIFNLRDYFLTEMPIIMVGCGAQDISIPESLETTHAMWMPCRCHKSDTWLQQIVSFLSVHLKVFVRLLTFLSGSRIHLPTIPSLRVTLSLKSEPINSIYLPWDLPLSIYIYIYIITNSRNV